MMAIISAAFIVTLIVVIIFLTRDRADKNDFEAETSEAEPEISEIQSEFVDEQSPFIPLTATVKGKYAVEQKHKSNYRVLYNVVFDSSEGRELAFIVSPEVFAKLEEGMSDTLVYHNRTFVGFGDIGALEMADEPEAGAAEEDFSYDDFDESIDVEIFSDMPGLENVAEDSLTPEQKKLYLEFQAREKLPSSTQRFSDDTQSPKRYDIRKFLYSSEILPFLKREKEIERLFSNTYKTALEDMLGYPEGQRKGTAADSAMINRNDFRLVVTVNEGLPQFDSKIDMEFGIND